MRFHFLGGANEVGASCTLLEVAAQKLLIDAGMRMNRQSGSALPELGRLQEVGAPDAILLTHAHTDHIGALPVVYLGFPQVPIYATEPTKALTQVLLRDSLRIIGVPLGKRRGDPALSAPRRGGHAGPHAARGGRPAGAGGRGHYGHLHPLRPRAERLLDHARHP